MNDWFADGATAEFCVTQARSIALKPATLTHEEGLGNTEDDPSAVGAALNCAVSLRASDLPLGGKPREQ
jgi:hypothetical protein